MNVKRSDIIFLVGYRATGKTTIGTELALMLEWGFVDLDKEIEERTSKNIKDIFSEIGEDKFRDIESEVLEDIFNKMSKVVVSTGGGCVIRERNREILRKGIVILFRSSINTIVNRMKKDNSRPPLVKGMTLEEEVKYTLSIRERFYEEVWDVSVLNEEVSPLILAKLIKNYLNS
jgi:shikimate kinase